MTTFKTDIPTETVPMPGAFTVEFSYSFQNFSGAVKDFERYPATLVGVHEVEGKFGTQFVWLFAITGRESEGTLAYYTSRKISNHPKAKLPKLLTSLGRSVPSPKNPVLDVSPGATCSIVCENVQKDGSDRTFPKIVKVLPA